jgi:hypothetical protein
MSSQTEKPLKSGSEITVRISLTFQEAPDVHTLLAMTPVRERGKLVRVALERYIAETGHPAGDVEQQIHAISTWLRSRTGGEQTLGHVAHRVGPDRPVEAVITRQMRDMSTHMPARSDSAPEETAGTSSSIKRWLQT